MSKINIILNGQNFQLEKGRNIKDLIEKLELDIKKIAIELNLEIVELNHYDSTKIKENDKIEIVHFIGGG
jgi:sulfur carrier protein